MVMAITVAGCTTEEKEITNSFNAPLNLGKDWKVYETSSDKVVYINPLYQTTNNGKRRFTMIKKATDIAVHKNFIQISKDQPQFKDLNFNRYSYMRTDELADCVTGSWVTEKHYLVDKNGVDMIAIDGRDLDDTVYQLTPSVRSMVCN
jgi:hypothetical protein